MQSRKGGLFRFCPVPAIAVGLALALLLAASPVQAQEECVSVELAEATRKDLPVVLHGIGTLQAEEEITVTPEISGRVTKVHFRDGQRVDKGDLLISLDSAKVENRLQARRAALREAKARMENARRTYQRQQRLFDKGVGSEEARDEAQTAYAAARAKMDRLRAEIDELQETLQDTRIRAPFAGILGESRVDSGQFVQPGTPLVLLVREDKLEVSFTVSEKHVSRISTGQEAILTLPGYPDRTFRGKVSYLEPVISQSTRSLRIKTTVDNSEGRLLPGGFASVRLTVDRLEKATVIPEEALIPTRKGYMVFTVQDGTAQAREVRIGLRRPGLVQIREGIEPGATVIRTGHISVQDGDEVCEKTGEASR